MKRLHKFLFFLFIASILMGHGFAEANEGKEAKKKCMSFVKSKCSGLKGQVPMQSSKAPALKKCNIQGYSGKKGFTFHAFLSNEPAQKANTKPVANGKDKSVCNVVKKAHKACHIVVKKGKTVLHDLHQVYKGKDSCILKRGQYTKDGKIAKNQQDSKVAIREKDSYEANKNPKKKKYQRLADIRKRGVVTKDTTPKSAQ